MKLGPLGVPGGVAPFLAFEAGLPVDCVWVDDELPAFVWELAAEFLPCVFDVAVRFAVLPDLPDDPAAVRLALLFEALLAEPLDLLLDPDDVEELLELPPVLDELDEDAAGGVAALGGGEATGVDKMESSATRSHSLRPDAL
jgi:hypothetical protein